jgi:hypothetical protein
MSGKNNKTMRAIVDKRKKAIAMQSIKEYMLYVNSLSFRNRFKLCWSILFKRGK